MKSWNKLTECERNENLKREIRSVQRKQEGNCRAMKYHRGHWGHVLGGISGPFRDIAFYILLPVFSLLLMCICINVMHRIRKMFRKKRKVEGKTRGFDAACREVKYRRCKIFFTESEMLFFGVGSNFYGILPQTKGLMCQTSHQTTARQPEEEAEEQNRDVYLKE